VLKDNLGTKQKAICVTPIFLLNPRSDQISLILSNLKDGVSAQPSLKAHAASDDLFYEFLGGQSD
jgi:hypothetical protein